MLNNHKGYSKMWTRTIPCQNRCSVLWCAVECHLYVAALDLVPRLVLWGFGSSGVSVQACGPFGCTR